MQVLGAGLEGGPTVLIEVDPVIVNEVGVQGALEGTEEGRTEDALEKLREIGGSIAEVCQSVHEAVAAGIDATKPNEFTLEFGVKIAGEGSAIISKVSGEAALKVTATWRRDPAVAQ
jgi:NTP-dependent ternary system trypsin peptidase co-occuring protein